MNIIEGLRAVFWSGAMKYVTVAEVLVAVLGILSWTFVSPFIGAVVAFGGLIGVQFVTHTYWMYQSMRDDEEFDHNPVYGAILGVAMMYALGLIGAIALLGILIIASSVTGVPLVLPGLVALLLGWIIYYRYA